MQASYVLLAAVIGTAAFAGLAGLPASSALVSAALLTLANFEVLCPSLPSCHSATLNRDLPVRPSQGGPQTSYTHRCDCLFFVNRKCHDQAGWDSAVSRRGRSRWRTSSARASTRS